MEEQFVEVKQCPPFRLLPEDIVDDITVTIGSGFVKGTKAIRMGLTDMENHIILPEIIQVSPKSEHWEKAVRDFYLNLEVRIPAGGLRLNKATVKKKVFYNGDTIDFDYPVSPIDYIKFRQVQSDPDVTMDPSEIDAGIYKAYVVDETVEKEKRNRLRRDKGKVEKAYLDLIEQNEEGAFVREQELKELLFNLGPQVYDSSDLPEVLERHKNIAIEQIDKGVDLKDTLFVKLYNDPNRKTKAIIHKLVSMNQIVKNENYFIDAEDPELILGSNIDQVVAFFKDQNNAAKVNKYKFLIKEQKNYV